MKKAMILLAVAIILISMVSGASQPKLKEVREKHEAKLFAIEGVSGVSVDEDKNEIIVYIERPEVSRKVPKALDGFPVKSRVIGKIQALQTTTAAQLSITTQATTYSRTGINRPVFGGISVGNPYITAGTLGLVTYDGYVLSNAHVLALNGRSKFLPIGTPILQPGKYDGGTSDNEIGKLHKYIPITFNNLRANNYADAAISTLVVNGTKGEVLDETDNGFYTISGTTEVLKGDTVRKSGRTTGVTTNTVQDTQASVRVSYGNKWAIFRDQIIVNHINQPFSKPGDSGSAVDKDGKFVGLVFAGSDTISVVNKAKYITSGLGISI
ncbi:hypothetical protein ANME2D_03210 [Candidatus Methanoperedens nitroreducens]|uniref:Uncharacterized protein n=1 Tax=Candidatus Methanoperedens nitratireducens TaxID=1392998 RepID=A0A062V3H8_9EURY|nr:hypothetical protein [Candidatus Methanoperedens nitroreducens]KCZ71178.1 hypothetical protein ANME2D_03210 [Candidatus Methanoperedens nitroreducens]MDJ1421444.1 hypothetical protein [Candidatus Methanoperedens sp.]